MAIKLEDAVAVVQKEICKWREKYESVAKTEEQDPIMIEGETSTGYYCQLMADPKNVAKVLLEYDYSVWRVHDEDAPDAMREDFRPKVWLRTYLLGGSTKARQKRHK